MSLGVALSMAAAVDRDTSPRPFLDLQIYQAATAALSDGNLYDTHLDGSSLTFTYPPFGALVLRVATAPDLPLAAFVWTLSSCALLYLVFRSSLSETARRLAPPAALIALIVSLQTGPVRGTLGFGQVNILLMAAICLPFLSAKPRVRDAGFAAMSAFAAGIKLTPLVFVAWSALVRPRRAGIWAIGGFLLTVLVGFLALPRESVEYWTTLLWDSSRVGSTAYVGNQSTLGVLSRALDDEPPPALWVAVVVALAVPGLLVSAALQARGLPGDRPIGLGLVGMTMLIASPISWTHHWVWACYLAVALIASLRPVSMTLGAAWLALLVGSPFDRVGDDYGRAWSVGERLAGNSYWILAVVTICVLFAVHRRDVLAYARELMVLAVDHRRIDSRE
ncbi:glycosyltransferase 87 family protein [Nocardioides hungaricus]